MLLHKTTKRLIDFKLDLQFHKEYFSIYTLDGYSFIILRTDEVGLKYLITYKTNLFRIRENNLMSIPVKLSKGTDSLEGSTIKIVGEHKQVLLQARKFLNVTWIRK